MGKTHIWSNRLLGANALNRMTHCGMILKRPGMRRSQGNTFEIAERPAKATCWLCREAVGLPKTIRFDVSEEAHSPAYFGSQLPDRTQMYCPGQTLVWCDIPQCKFGVIVTEFTAGRSFEDWIRVVVPQCPGLHMLIIQYTPQLFGVLRAPSEFTQGKPYDPDFDIGSATPKLLPSRYDRLMED